MGKLAFALDPSLVNKRGTLPPSSKFDLCILLDNFCPLGIKVSLDKSFCLQSTKQSTIFFLGANNPEVWGFFMAPLSFAYACQNGDKKSGHGSTCNSSSQ